MNPIQTAIIDGYRELTCAEDKLTYLMEREPTEPLLSVLESATACKVPGCLSGLWLEGSVSDGLCRFRCRSESEVVESIVSVLCDLASGRAPADVSRVLQGVVPSLGLEGLLSLTRKAAVAKSVAFMINYAEGLRSVAA